MEIQSSSSDTSQVQQPTVFSVKNEVSQEELKKSINSLVNATHGKLVELPNHQQLCVVQHGDHQLEWTKLGDGRTSSYIVRDKDKNVLAESENGSTWKMGSGGDVCILGEGEITPKAQFGESTPDIKSTDAE
jgi:hypothetical protein